MSLEHSSNLHFNAKNSGVDSPCVVSNPLTGQVITQPARTDYQHAPLSKLAGFFLTNAPVETFAIALGLTATALIRSLKHSNTRKLHYRGVNMEDVPIQINFTGRDERGLECLMFRTLATRTITSLIRDALVKDFGKLAKNTKAPDFLLRFNQPGASSLLHEICEHLPELANNVTEPIRNYYVFITCENPEKSAVKFTRKARVFLVDEKDVEKFSNTAYTEILRTEKPIHKQRVGTLHHISRKLKSGELKEGQDYARMQLRIKTSDYSPIYHQQ